MTFALANLETSVGDRAALLVEGRYFRLDQLAGDRFACGLRPLMDDWFDLWPQLQRLAAAAAKDGENSSAHVANARLLAPIKYPNKLVCVGATYSDHLKEFGLPPTRWERMPIFLRAPTTSIVGPGRTLVMPRVTKEFDWEVELAVVIGRRLSEGDENSARAAIAGYTIGLDMTCRDMLFRDGPAGPDLIRGKAQDGMAPLGSVMRPASFVGDPQALKLKLSVNGEIKQDGTTSDMLFSVYEQIATISQLITLEPGDVIFTGSPAGSGASIGQFLKPGDTIKAEIEKVCDLEIGLLAKAAVEPRREALARV